MFKELVCNSKLYYFYSAEYTPFIYPNGCTPSDTYYAVNKDNSWLRIDPALGKGKGVGGGRESILLRIVPRATGTVHQGTEHKTRGNGAQQEARQHFRAEPDTDNEGREDD